MADYERDDCHEEDQNRERFCFIMKVYWAIIFQWSLVLIWFLVFSNADTQKTMLWHKNKIFICVVVICMFILLILSFLCRNSFVQWAFLINMSLVIGMIMEGTYEPKKDSK